MERHLTFFEAQDLREKGFSVTQLTFDVTSLHATELYRVEDPVPTVMPARARLTPEEIAAWRAKAPEREAARQRVRNLNAVFRSIGTDFIPTETPTGPNGEPQILFVHDDGRRMLFTILPTMEGATVTALPAEVEENQ